MPLRRGELVPTNLHSCFTLLALKSLGLAGTVDEDIALIAIILSEKSIDEVVVASNSFIGSQRLERRE